MMMMMMTIKRGAPQRVVKIFHDQCEKKIITMSIMPVGMMVKDGDTLTLSSIFFSSQRLIPSFLTSRVGTKLL